MQIILVHRDGRQRVFDLSSKYVLEALAKFKALRIHQKPYSFFTTALAYYADQELEEIAAEEERQNQRRYLQAARGSGKGGLPKEQTLLFPQEKGDEQ